MSTFVESAPSTLKQSASLANRIQQPWLSIVRLGFITLTLVTITLFTLGIPVTYRNFTSVCQAEPCAPMQQSTEVAQAIKELGFSLEGVAVYIIALSTLMACAYLIMGVLIFWRKSDEWFGIFLATASIVYLYNSIRMPELALKEFFGAGFPIYLIINIAQAMFYQFPFLMPDGKYPQRWTAVPPIAMGLWLMLSGLLPDSPFAVGNVSPVIYVLAQVGILGASVYAQIYKYRTSSSQETRQQTKWIAYGLSIALTLIAIPPILMALIPAMTATPRALVLTNFFEATVSVPALIVIPVTLSISILRFRLWDIDTIINRSLLYGAMLIMMLAVLIGGVYGLQTLFVKLTGQTSDLAVVIATIASILIIQPAQSWMQKTIDNAFFRSKVDAQQAVMAFSRKIRSIITLPEVLKQIVDPDQDYFHMAWAAIYLVDEDGTLRMVEQRNLPDGKATRLPLSTSAMASLQQGDAVPTTGVFELILPLRAEFGDSSEFVGVMALGPRRSGQAYNADDRAVLLSLAAQAGPAIYVARLAQVQQRKLEEANRLKTEFLATMSHELRTPLHAIIGYADVELAGIAGPLNEEQREHAERILVNADHLLGLINDVLDIAKIEAGRMEVTRRPIKLAEWSNNLSRLMQGLADQKGIGFEIMIDDHMPERIVSDPDHLKQIAINLISNAVKFTDTGKVQVAIATHGRNTWTLVVRDTGIGIPAHAQEYIFDEFRQVDGSSSRQYGGTGLGLAIVRKLTLLLGGNIRVESEPGQGSTFTVLLPLSIPDEPAGEVEIQHDSSFTAREVA